MRLIGGKIEGLIGCGPVLRGLRGWVGQLAVNAIERDALTALLEVEGGLPQPLKPLENLLRNDPAVIAASAWLEKLAGSLGISYQEAISLVNAVTFTDASVDDLIFLIKPERGLIDVNRLENSIAEGEVEFVNVPGPNAGIDAYIACPKRSSLPRVAGVVATPHNVPARLLSLAEKLGKRTRQKGLFGSDKVYIRVKRLEVHCDPSLVLIPEKTMIIVYGDWLNGLKTVIKALANGRARQMIFYDF